MDELPSELLSFIATIVDDSDLLGLRESVNYGIVAGVD